MAAKTLLGGSMLCVGLSVVAGLAFYYAPTGIALLRGHRNMAPILIVNLFFGWLLIGWVVALAWAFAADATPEQGNKQ